MLPQPPMVDCPICSAPIRTKVPSAALNFAISVQTLWMQFTWLCHGLLAGFGLAQLLYIDFVYRNQDRYCAQFIAVNIWLFYFLCVICMVSLFDMFDFEHLDTQHCVDLFEQRRVCLLMAVYAIAIVVHTANIKMDYRIGSGNNPWTHNNINRQIENNELNTWHILSLIRGILVLLAWIILSFISRDCMLTIHLKNMQKYII